MITQHTRGQDVYSQILETIIESDSKDYLAIHLGFDHWESLYDHHGDSLDSLTLS